jgi:Flp pilus assembly protein TadG
MNRRGTTAVATAIMMATTIGAAGLAVDTTRVWLVETRLKTAVDAAALAAARRLDEPNRDTEASAVFWSHFIRPDGTQTYLGATIAGPTIAAVAGSTNRLSVQGTATIPLTLFSILGDGNVTRTGTATAQRGGGGLELAIVMDHSSSMGAAASGGGTKLEAARTAANTMLDVLYGGADTQRNLFVSVVPFSRTINIGTGNSGMLDTSSMPVGWNLNAWSGCVEARRSGHDTTDAAPTGTARFRPYFWPSTYRAVGTYSSGGQSRCVSHNAYPAGTNSPAYCHGDNDWPATGQGPTQSQLDQNEMYDYLRDRGMAHNQVVGPNILCALTPIQPLTASRMAVNAALAAITTPIRSGGTTIATGLHGAWYTLSPSWQGWWQNTNAGVPNVPTLPMPYNAPNMRKVVVMLTDGDNNWQSASAYSDSGSGCGSSNDSVCSSLTGTELLYNAYGRVATYNQQFPTATISPVTQSNADARLDQRFSAVCTAMKAANVGITIYVIGFEVATSAHRTLLQNCATSAAHYFESPTTAELQTVFRQVGAQLAAVRMTD